MHHISYIPVTWLSFPFPEGQIAVQVAVDNSHRWKWFLSVTSWFSILCGLADTSLGRIWAKIPHQVCELCYKLRQLQLGFVNVQKKNNSSWNSYGCCLPISKLVLNQHFEKSDHRMKICITLFQDWWVINKCRKCRKKVLVLLFEDSFQKP